MSSTPSSKTLESPISDNPPAAPIDENPWPAVGTLCRRELVRFLRQRNRVFGALGQPIIFWLLFSEGFRGSQFDYVHFFPGTLVMILLFTAIFATISLIEDRREGFLQSVLIAPVPRWAMTLGILSGGAALAMFQALLFLVLGYLTLDGLAVDPLAIGQVVLLMAVASLALTALGFVIAWRMESTHGFHAIMSLVLLPMWLLSGSFFPPGEGWMVWIVSANPLTYSVAGLRQLLVDGQVDGPSLSTCWAATVAFALVMFALACLSSRRGTKGDLLS